jgi:hypothetical protein
MEKYAGEQAQGEQVCKGTYMHGARKEQACQSIQGTRMHDNKHAENKLARDKCAGDTGTLIQTNLNHTSSCGHVLTMFDRRLCGIVRLF